MKRIDLTTLEINKYQVITALYKKKKKDRACVKLGLSRLQVNTLILDYKQEEKLLLCVATEPRNQGICH